MRTLGEADRETLKIASDVFMRLKWCGCGVPEAALWTLRLTLEVIAAERAVARRIVLAMVKSPAHTRQVADDPYLSFCARSEALHEAVLPHLGSRYLIWYALTTADILDHGSSVPGWLTRDGEALLTVLRWRDAERMLEAQGLATANSESLEWGYALVSAAYCR